MVRDIAGQIIASGYVTSFTHAALGARIATLTSQGGVLGGARIWAVIPGAASGRAGLSAADTIRPAGPAPAPIAEALAVMRPGQDVVVTITRYTRAAHRADHPRPASRQLTGCGPSQQKASALALESRAGCCA